MAICRNRTAKRYKLEGTLLSITSQTQLTACTILQVAEEEGLITTPGELDVEPYFVDFLRDAPEMTGSWKICSRQFIIQFTVRH